MGTILFRVEPERGDQIIEYIQKMPNIQSAWRLGESSEIIVAPTLRTQNEIGPREINN